MSRSQVVECDRCGAVASEHKIDRDGWGRLFAATLSGMETVGTAETPADLCDECMAELVAFMGYDAEARTAAA